MKRLVTLMFTAMLLTGVVSVGNATTSSEVTFVNAHFAIHYLDSVFDDLRKKTTAVIFFPTSVPHTKMPLFADVESLDPAPNYNQYWVIRVNTQKHCQIKSCQVGSMSATDQAAVLQNYFVAPLSDRKSLRKEKVILSHHLLGYYTPAHAEADWQYPQIEWVYRNRLYQLQWNLPNTTHTKRILEQMANSAIEARLS